MSDISSVSPLPDALAARFKAWRQDGFDEAHFDRNWPRANPDGDGHFMLRQPRVQSTEIFDVPAGSFFIHRNIANLVPIYQPGGNGHGTASALEYAVKALKVPHLIIMGHSACGGACKACYEMCENNVAAEDASFEFVGHWLEILRPAHGRISGRGQGCAPHLYGASGGYRLAR